MNEQLDLKDRKILVELDTDASQSLRQIARKLRMTKEAVHYRIKQLEEKGIISNYVGIYHTTKIGLTHYKIYLKYLHIKDSKKAEIINHILKEKRFVWFANTEGAFDLMISIHFFSVFDFERFKDRLFSRFDSVFHKSSFAILTEAESYPMGYLTGGEMAAKKPFVFCGSSKKEKIDADDLKILKALSINGRAASSDIARMTGLTDRIVRYRKGVLEKKGIIVGYKIIADYRKMNHMFFKCLIKLQGGSSKRIHDLKMYARSHPNILHWLRVLGEWDIELEIQVPDINTFYSISNDIKNRFSDIIQTFDALIVTEEHLSKYN